MVISGRGTAIIESGSIFGGDQFDNEVIIEDGDPLKLIFEDTIFNGPGLAARFAIIQFEKAKIILFLVGDEVMAEEAVQKKALSLSIRSSQGWMELGVSLVIWLKWVINLEPSGWTL